MVILSTGLFTALGACGGGGGGGGGGVVAPPLTVTGQAHYTDVNRNGVCDAGDKIVVPFSAAVSVSGADESEFSLPVTGDSLGTGATVASGPSATEVTITLGTGPLTIKSRQAFAAGTLTANCPSGIDVSSAVTADTIQRTSDGVDATASTAIDIVPSFVDSTQTLGSSFSIDSVLADLDGDGDLDLVDPDWTSDNRTWLNDGTGTFTDTGSPMSSSSTRSIALGDVNGDGALDCVEAIPFFGAPVKVWLGDGAGGFTDSGQTLGSGMTFGVALGDVDRDGDLDIFTGNAGAGNKVWRNDGSGTFADTGQSLGTNGSVEVLLGDVDGDGDLDCVEGNTMEPNCVWRNDGSGTFTDSGQSLGNHNTVRLALADVDRDGDLDQVEVITDAATRIWLNNGSGVFTDSGQRLDGVHSCYAVEIVDYDADGDADIVAGYADATGSGTAPNRIWLNDGEGTFSDSGIRMAGKDTVSLAVGDLDGDGDIVEGNSADDNTTGGPNRVWMGSVSGTWGSVTLTDSGQTLGTARTYGCVLADLDGDGDLDCVSGNFDQPNKVWLNQ